MRALRAGIGAAVLLGAALLGSQLAAFGEHAGGALSARAPSCSPLAPIAPDAESYAQANGITPEEAACRLAFEPSIGELNAALEQGEAATFAGLWIEHSPRYRVVASFTRDGETTLARYVAGTELAAVVEVEQAQYTLARLRDDIATLSGVLKGLRFTAGVNVQANRIDIEVGARAEVEAFMRDRGVKLPETAYLIHVTASPSLDCSDESGRPYGVFFPRHCAQPWEPMMLALIEGVLTVRDGCLLIGDDLAIWPPGWTVAMSGDRLEVRDAQRLRVWSVGETVQFGGGQGSNPEHIADFIGSEPPSECRGRNAWVVSSH